MQKIQRAVLSVSDKRGLIPFAQILAEAGVELISTGGTAKALRAAGLTVQDLSDYTGFPEMLDGRVKTLHPKVHGGLLYLRGNPVHEAAVQAHGIKSIDLVVVNLYPFEETVAKADVSLHEAIENIDIGGPSMLRSAAKITERDGRQRPGRLRGSRRPNQGSGARRWNCAASWRHASSLAQRLTTAPSPRT
jgi:phosphoribosylaminoimidazolecarboxamide formyltransferase/IMP cyclohydrolase